MFSAQRAHQTSYLFNDHRPRILRMEPFVRTFTRGKEESSPGLSSPTPIIIAPLSPEGPPHILGDPWTSAPSFHHVCPTDQFITYERVQPMAPCQAPQVADMGTSLRQRLQLQHDKFVQDVETHLHRCPSDHWPRHLLHCYYREVQGLEALRYAAVTQNYQNIPFHPIIHQFYDKEHNVLLGQASHSFTSYMTTRFVDSGPQKITSCFPTPDQVDSLGLPSETAPQQMTSCTPDQVDSLGLPAETPPQQITSCTPDQVDSLGLPAETSPQQITSCTPDQVDSLGLPAETPPQQITSCTPDQVDNLGLPAETLPQQITYCTPDQVDNFPADTAPQQMMSCFLTPAQVDSLGLPTGTVVRQVMSSFPSPDYLTSLDTIRSDPDPATREKSLSRRPRLASTSRHRRTTENWFKKHRALPYFKPYEADLSAASPSIHKVQGMSRRPVADRKASSTSLSHRDSETSSKVRRRNKLRSLMPTSHRSPAVPHTDHSLKQEFPPMCSIEELTIFLTTESQTS